MERGGHPGLLSLQELLVTDSVTVGLGDLSQQGRIPTASWRGDVVPGGGSVPGVSRMGSLAHEGQAQ